MINKRERKREIDAIKEFENKNNTPLSHTHPSTQGLGRKGTMNKENCPWQRNKRTRGESNDMYKTRKQGPTISSRYWYMEKKQGYDGLYTWILHLGEVGLEWDNLLIEKLFQLLTTNVVLVYYNHNRIVSSAITNGDGKRTIKFKEFGIEGWCNWFILRIMLMQYI